MLDFRAALDFDLGLELQMLAHTVVAGPIDRDNEQGITLVARAYVSRQCTAGALHRDSRVRQYTPHCISPVHINAVPNATVLKA